MRGGRKNCCMSETVRDRAKVTINHYYRSSTYPFNGHSNQQQRMTLSDHVALYCTNDTYFGSYDGNLLKKKIAILSVAKKYSPGTLPSRGIRPMRNCGYSSGVP